MEINCARESRTAPSPAQAANSHTARPTPNSYLYRGSGRSLLPVGNLNVNHASVEGDAPAAAFLTLGHVLAALGADHDPPISLDDVRVIRHSFNTGEELGLRGPED